MSLIVKNISISSYLVQSNSSNLANSVQYKYRFCLHTVKCQNSSILNNSVQCKYSFIVKNSSISNNLVLFNPQIGPYQVLPFRVDLRAMAMKGCSTFPNAPASLEPHHQIVQCPIQDTRWGGVLTLCRGAVCVFYRPSRQGNHKPEGIHRHHEIIYTQVPTDRMVGQAVRRDLSSQEVWRAVGECPLVKNLLPKKQRHKAWNIDSQRGLRKVSLQHSSVSLCQGPSSLSHSTLVSNKGESIYLYKKMHYCLFVLPSYNISLLSKILKCHHS